MRSRVLQLDHSLPRDAVGRHNGVSRWYSGVVGGVGARTVGLVPTTVDVPPITLLAWVGEVVVSVAVVPRSLARHRAAMLCAE